MPALHMYMSGQNGGSVRVRNCTCRHFLKFQAFSNIWTNSHWHLIFYVDWDPSLAFFSWSQTSIFFMSTGTHRWHFFLGAPLAFFLCRLGPFHGIFGFQSPTRLIKMGKVDFFEMQGI